MAGDRFRRFIDEEPKGRARFHQGEGLLVTVVEGGGLVPVHDPLPDLPHVVLRRRVLQVVGISGGSSLVGHLHVLTTSALTAEVEWMSADV